MMRPFFDGGKIAILDAARDLTGQPVIDPGLVFWSSGSIMSCDRCARDYGAAADCLGGSFFTWSACETCGSGLGGNREVFHARRNGPHGGIEHFHTCEDCAAVLHTVGGACDLPDEMSAGVALLVAARRRAVGDL